MLRFALLAASTALALSAAPAQAATITTFYGENTKPANIVTGAPKSAKANFLAHVGAVGVENFSGFSDGTDLPLELKFVGTSVTATLQGSGFVAEDTGGGLGRFNTTDADDVPTAGNYVSSATRLLMAFNQNMMAFGLMVTDLGDFEGSLLVRLFNDGQQVGEALTVPATGGVESGSLLFWGVKVAGGSFDSLSIDNLSIETSGDRAGFDDFLVRAAERGQPVSAPGMLALAGLGLAGLGAARRRR